MANNINSRVHVKYHIICELVRIFPRHCTDVVGVQTHIHTYTVYVASSDSKAIRLPLCVKSKASTVSVNSLKLYTATYFF